MVQQSRDLGYRWVPPPRISLPRPRPRPPPSVMESETASLCFHSSTEVTPTEKGTGANSATSSSGPRVRGLMNHTAYPR